MSDGYYDFVDKARTFACGIYKNVPGALVPNVSDAGYKKIWDRLCYNPPPAEDPGLPDPPAPPFSGGQCEYLYYINYINSSGSPVIQQKGVRGPIYSYKLKKEATGIGSPFDFAWTFLVDCHRMIPPFDRIIDRIDAGYATYGEARFLGFEPAPVNGVVPPDSCGDPEKQFPVPANPVPPDGFTSPPQPIQDNDQIINFYIFNFFPPSRSRTPDADFPPIEFRVTSASADPVTQIPYVDFNLNLNFDGTHNADGSGSAGGGALGDMPKQINNINNIVSGLGFVGSPPDFATSPNVDKENSNVGDGKEEDKDGLLGLLLTLTRLPDKAHFGTPNVYFAGWVAFKTQQGYLPREQINFESSYFQAPPGSTGYTCTLTNGSQASITVYTGKQSQT